MRSGSMACSPFDDPLASINVSFYGDDEELGWHFDNSTFAVTLILREAEKRGAFEYVRNSRRETAAGYAAMSRILDGKTTGAAS